MGKVEQLDRKGDIFTGEVISGWRPSAKTSVVEVAGEGFSVRVRIPRRKLIDHDPDGQVVCVSFDAGELINSLGLDADLPERRVAAKKLGARYWVENPGPGRWGRSGETIR
jgi:hypothetical protein